MNKKKLYVILGLLCTLVFAFTSFADMSSNNYTISTSVMSSGGGPMGSGSYQTNSTLGQSSPLIDPTDPPRSTNYDLYPGFWYTLEVEITGCEDLSSFASAYGSISPYSNYNSQCDFDVDGDVDGSDLSEFIAAYGP